MTVYLRRERLRARRWRGVRQFVRHLRAFVETTFWVIAALIALYVFLSALVGIEVLTWAALK
ncbi:MAG: hypothetical protein Kow00120_30930 [Anaerolineae bacterium]